MTEHSPSYFVSESSNKANIRLSLWPADSNLHVSMEFSAADALKLAKRIEDQANKLPRVAEASDLGLVA